MLQLVPWKVQQYSTIAGIQGLALSEGKKSYSLEEEEGVGDGRAEGWSAIGDPGQAAISLMPDMHATGFVSWLDSVLSTFLLLDILGLK